MAEYAELGPVTGTAPNAVLGIDVGGTSVKAAVVREGVVVGEGMSPAHDRPDAETLRASMRAAALRAIGACGGAVEIGRIGLAVPGLLSPERDRVLRAVNLPGLAGLDLRAEARRAVESTGARAADAGVVVSSDAFAVAYGWWCRERPAGRSMAMVMGTGVGVAVLDDGVPLECTGAGPGHWGQIDVGPIVWEADGRAARLLGPDGGANSLEAFVGARALERYADEWGPLDQNNPAVIAISRAVRIALAVLRPDRIVLLGGVGEVLGPVIPAIRRLVETDLTAVAPGDFELQSVAGRGLGAFGVASWAARD